MSEPCIFCGNKTMVYTWVEERKGYHPVCPDCSQKIYRKEIDEKCESLSEPRDFQEWKKRDMSEAFWSHLGKYVKHPNKHSLSIISMAFRWACHADHGLSNSFANALRWCNIDLLTEEERKDLPER